MRHRPSHKKRSVLLYETPEHPAFSQHRREVSFLRSICLIVFGVLTVVSMGFVGIEALVKRGSFTLGRQALVFLLLFSAGGVTMIVLGIRELRRVRRAEREAKPTPPVGLVDERRLRRRNHSQRGG